LQPGVGEAFAAVVDSAAEPAALPAALDVVGLGDGFELVQQPSITTHASVHLIAR
jgi:hypothetical protein